MSGIIKKLKEINKPKANEFISKFCITFGVTGAFTLFIMLIIRLLSMNV